MAHVERTFSINQSIEQMIEVAVEHRSCVCVVEVYRIDDASRRRRRPGRSVPPCCRCLNPVRLLRPSSYNGAHPGCCLFVTQLFAGIVFLLPRDVADIFRLRLWRIALSAARWPADDRYIIFVHVSMIQDHVLYFYDFLVVFPHWMNRCCVVRKHSH